MKKSQQAFILGLVALGLLTSCEGHFQVGDREVNYRMDSGLHSCYMEENNLAKPRETNPARSTGRPGFPGCIDTVKALNYAVIDGVSDIFSRR